MRNGRNAQDGGRILSLALIFGLAAGCTDGGGDGEQAQRNAEPADSASGNAGQTGEESGGEPAVMIPAFDGEDIKVNQVGYLPDAPKIGVLEGDAEADRFQGVCVPRGESGADRHKARASGQRLGRLRQERRPGRPVLGGGRAVQDDR